MKNIEGKHYAGWRMTSEPADGPCWYRHRWVLIKRAGLVNYYRCGRCSARFARQDENSGQMQLDVPWVMKMTEDPA